MAKRTSLKQIKFVQKYIETGNGTLAAKESYAVKNDRTAASIASENLAKPDIRALIDSFTEKAANRIEKLADSAKSEFVKLQANQDILDRAGYEPKQAANGGNINVQINVVNFRHNDPLPVPTEEVSEGSTGSTG